jgi:uncharacterized protein with FMN-binding domain
MSHARIMVFKMRDLQLPAIMLLVALAVFTYLLFANKTPTVEETFSPSIKYTDGQYTASISLADADIDLIVEVNNHQITSVSLDNFTDAEKAIYKDIASTISFVNDYVLSTQSAELPATENISTASVLLMNAVKIALSEDQSASYTTTYQTPMIEELSTVEDGMETEETLSEELLIEDGVLLEDETDSTDKVAP